MYTVRISLSNEEQDAICALGTYSRNYALKYIQQKYPGMRRIDAIMIVKSLCQSPSTKFAQVKLSGCYKIARNNLRRNLDLAPLV